MKQSLPIFNDLNSFDIYSKKANPKTLVQTSHKSFFKKLSAPTSVKSTRDIWKDNLTEEFNKQKHSTYARNFDIDLISRWIMNNTLNMSNKEKLRRYLDSSNQPKLQISRAVSERTKYNLNFIYKQNKIIVSSTADIGKYNPNYDLVRPGIRRINFGKYIPRKERKASNAYIEHDEDDKESSSNHKDNKGFNSTFGTNNHALKFSKLHWRRNESKGKENELKNEMKKSQSMKTIEVRKMKSGTATEMFDRYKSGHELFKNIKEDNMPMIGMYNPNYSMIMSNTPTIKFGKEKVVWTPKYKVKKLWCSYGRVGNTYTLVKWKDKAIE